MSVSSWLQNLAAYSLQIALLVIIGSLLPPILRLRTPGTLLAYCQGLLAVCLLLPVIQPWKPAIVASTSVSVVQQTVRPVGGRTPAQPFSRNVALGLGAGVAARLLWLTLGFWRLRQYLMRAQPLREIPPAVREIEATTGVTSNFYVSDDITGPVTFGVLRPVILVPSRFLRMATEMQAAIACHELVHVRRRDWIFIVAEELLRVLFWFHPAIWWLLGQIQLAREQVVDRMAVAITSNREHYLQALLEIAGSKILPDLIPAPLFLRKHLLTRRVSMLMKEVYVSKPRLIAFAAALAGGVFLAARLAVWSFPLQSQAAPQPARIRVGGNVQASKVVYQVKPVYPPEAKSARLQGSVQLQAVIAEDGTVKDLEVLSGEPVLADAAIEAVKQWRYLPTLLNGKPVEVVTLIDVNFTLADSAATGQNSKSEPVLQVGDGVSAPRLIDKVEPEYTQEARDAKIEGAVVLSVEVTPEGRAQNIHVVQGLDSGLDEKAIAAISQWRFEPGSKDGKPVTVAATIEVNFRLQ